MNVNEITKGDTSILMDGKKINIKLPILQSITYDKILILLLNDYGLSCEDPHVGRNVVSIASGGREKWRIEAFWWKVKCKDHLHKVPDSYSHIRIGEDGKLYAYQPIGFICEIDPETGKILSEHQTR